jgi:hypothetical protein
MLYHILQIIFAYLFADFIIGVYHWIKDTYFSHFTPVIGYKFIWFSRLHHIKPRYITEIPNHQIMLDSAIWTALWIGPMVWISGFKVFWVMLYLMISLNDIIHKYAHVLDHERPLIVTRMQCIGLIQTHEEHHMHHVAPYIQHYCPITPYVNGPLERINFWRNLENIIEKLTGVPPRAHETAHVEDPTYPAHVRFIKKKLS